MVSSEDWAHVDLFDGCGDHCVLIDGDSPPSKMVFDLLQSNDVANKVLTLIPFEGDLIMHLGFFGGGEFYLSPDMINEGSGRVLGVACVFVVHLLEVLGIDGSHDAL